MSVISHFGATDKTARFSLPSDWDHAITLEESIWNLTVFDVAMYNTLCCKKPDRSDKESPQVMSIHIIKNQDSAFLDRIHTNGRNF